MIASVNFVADFERCMGSPKWLPFESSQFVVGSPEIYGNGPYNYPVKTPDGQRIGLFSIEFDYWGDPKTFWIVEISTKHRGKNALGYGRELVRRAVYFARQKHYKRVRTSHYAEDGGSFWPAMGFRSISPVSSTIEPFCKPRWGKVRGHIQEKAEWKKKLSDNPNSLCDFAQTEIGRRVLRHTSGIGLLDLQDAKQRTYAFKRLLLPNP